MQEQKTETVTHAQIVAANQEAELALFRAITQKAWTANADELLALSTAMSHLRTTMDLGQR